MNNLKYLKKSEEACEYNVKNNMANILTVNKKRGMIKTRFQHFS